MDEEIDIEEHDILEHPQVKAVFPDLSKIHIQVHTGDTFLDEPRDELEDNEDEENNFEAQAHLNGVKDENFVEELSDDAEEVAVEEMETLEVSDSEGTDGQILSYDNVINDNKSSQKVYDLDTECIDDACVKAVDLIDGQTSDIFDQNENVNDLNESEQVHEVFDDVREKNDEIEDTNELNEDLDEAVEEQSDFIDPLNSDDLSGDDNNPTSDVTKPDKYEVEVNIESYTHEDNDDFHPTRIKEEIVFESDASDYEEILPTLYNEPRDVVYSNKIILGSKPVPKRNSSNYLVVMLEDWGAHLRESACYCSDCQTLFTTPNALDFHRMSAHSLLAPITNRALKSTTKSPYKNVSKKSTAREISKSTYCNHCNVSFKDHTSLIKHLYELLPVNKYSCNECEASFTSQTELVNHNVIHVKQEPRKILKAKKPSNPILRKLLNSDVKAKAIKRQLPVEEKVSKKLKVNNVKIKTEPESTEDSWKCTVCRVVFDGYGPARKHRVEHPDIKSGTPILERIIKTKVKTKTKLTFEKEKKPKNDKPVVLIQSSALFQCTKCGLHLPSSTAGNSHITARQCGVHIKTWWCNFCKKKMRLQDKMYHLKQHQCGTKLKIYKITKNMYDTTLCRCLKCNIYFQYNTLVQHISKCGKIVSVKCKECNINIPKYRALEHTLKHTSSMKLKRKDFIFIDYTVKSLKNKAANSNKAKIGKKIKSELEIEIDPEIRSKLKSQLEMKIEPKSQTKIKPIKIKTEPDQLKNKLSFEKEKQNLIYCNYCKCVFTRRYRGTNNHITKQCIKRPKAICRICGLKVYSKLLSIHVKLHTVKKLTLNDFVFNEYLTSKTIVPPIPEFPSCEKCRIHFLSNIMIANHICGEDYENCEVCGEKFENSALKAHLPHHQLAKKPPRQMLPELIMKYESLNAIWNILFKCSTCDLVTDVYDSAVIHSQSHIEKSNSQPNTIKCYICNLKFDGSCWSKHSNLHSRMPINNKHFRILEYTPDDLLEETWFRMFANLPEKETRQILDRSLFGSERSLKMVMFKNGLPEFTIYSCSLCRVCCDNNNILQHANSVCETYEDVCTECDLAFDDPTSLENHMSLHERGIKKDEFRIVLFVKNSQKNNKEIKKYTLYKCVECTVCLFTKYVEYHICAPEHHIKYCKICKQNFSVRQSNAHQMKHAKVRDFRAKNIEVVDFVPIPAGKDKPMRPNRYKTKKMREEMRKAKKKQKRLEKSSIQEPTSSKQSSESFESKKRRLSSEERTAKLFKCQCGLHYTSLRSAQRHVDDCDNNDDISKENCSKCGLLFPTDLLVAHLCRHHSRSTRLSVEELTKTETPRESLQTQTASTKTEKDPSIKLYKCAECNVYFINQKSCYQHVNKHKPLDSRHYIECKLCRLQFRILSLHIHMKKHHESEFLLEKVLVEEYQPMVGKEAPKIDIYFANERIDNVQVSSSNDD